MRRTKHQTRELIARVFEVPLPISRHLAHDEQVAARIEATCRENAETLLEISGRTRERSKSNRSSTFDDTLLTFCPPGPDDRTDVQRSSSAGIVRAGETTSGADMVVAKGFEGANLRDYPARRGGV